jgi:dienelactone hydrolase
VVELHDFGRMGWDSRHQADWLADPDWCTDRIGVIGFRMGGGYAWRWPGPRLRCVE